MLLQLTQIQRDKDYLCSLILLILFIEGANEVKDEEKVLVSKIISKILNHEISKIESAKNNDNVPIRIEGNLSLLAFIKLSIMTFRINSTFNQSAAIKLSIWITKN